MMNTYFVFDTEAAALEVEALMVARGRALFEADGYSLDDDGNVIGMRLGVPDPTAQVTERWDIPRERLDGKWVVAHPDCLPAGTEVLPSTGGLSVSQVVAQGIIAPTELYDPAWFPKLAEGV